MTAGYLIEGSAPVLVETGSQSSVPALLDALDALGVDAGDLAGVAVTHIHLDHAGGVGDVARAFPSATVYVHEKGARHLVDPTRLIESAARVYGPLLDSLYGRLDPTPRNVSMSSPTGRRSASGRAGCSPRSTPPGTPSTISPCTTPGSGILFAGDAVGVRLPDAGVLRPSTPPPDFDLDQAITSLGRFADRSPSQLALAHYGVLSDPHGRAGRSGGDPAEVGRRGRGGMAAAVQTSLRRSTTLSPLTLRPWTSSTATSSTR